MEVTSSKIGTEDKDLPRGDFEDLKWFNILQINVISLEMDAQQDVMLFTLHSVIQKHNRPL